MEARYPADRFESDLLGYARTKAGIDTYAPRKIKPKMPTTINRLRGSINRINRNIKEMQDNIDNYVARKGEAIDDPVGERDVLRDIYERSVDKDKFGDMEISVLFDDIDNIKITEAEWNKLYSETLAELRQNVKDGYFYANDELETFLETTKAQKKSAWKKLNKEFNQKADEIGNTLSENNRKIFEKNVESGQKFIDAANEVLQDHTAALNKKKSQVDNIRGQINERLDKLELNIEKKFERKKIHITQKEINYTKHQVLQMTQHLLTK